MCFYAAVGYAALPTGAVAAAQHLYSLLLMARGWVGVVLGCRGCFCRHAAAVTAMPPW